MLHWTPPEHSFAVWFPLGWLHWGFDSCNICTFSEEHFKFPLCDRFQVATPCFRQFDSFHNIRARASGPCSVLLRLVRQEHTGTYAKLTHWNWFLVNWFTLWIRRRTISLRDGNLTYYLTISMMVITIIVIINITIVVVVIIDIVIISIIIILIVIIIIDFW